MLGRAAARPRRARRRARLGADHRDDGRPGRESSGRVADDQLTRPARAARSNSVATEPPCAAASRRRRARVRGRRLRAGAGRAGAAVPRHPAGRAGADGPQHPGLGRLRGRPVRRHARPRTRRRRGPDPRSRSTARSPAASPRTSTRARCCVDGAPGVAGHGARRRCRPSGSAARRCRSTVAGHAVEEAAVSAPPDERGSALVELTWLGHPAAGAAGVDRALGLRGAARRVRGQRRRPGRRPRLRARRRRRRRARRAREAAARQALADQGVDGQPPDVRSSRCGRPATATARGAVITVRVALPRRPAAAADVLGGGRAQLRAGLDATPCPIGQFRDTQ